MASKRIRIRWDRIAGMIALAIVLAWLGNWAIDLAIEDTQPSGLPPYTTEEK